MTEIENLRALLAEARDALEPLAEGVPLLMDRIDAVLAEPSVAWAPEPFWGGDAVEARVDGCYIDVHALDDAEEFPWQWSVSRTEIAECGEAKTKQAAMEAALQRHIFSKVLSAQSACTRTLAFKDFCQKWAAKAPKSRPSTSKSRPSPASPILVYVYI